MKVLVSHYQTVMFKEQLYGCVFTLQLPIATVHCPQDVDAEYGVRWPPTIANMDATNNCPDGSGMSTE